jgi:hypothetical protein
MDHEKKIKHVESKEPKEDLSEEDLKALEGLSEEDLKAVKDWKRYPSNELIEVLSKEGFKALNEKLDALKEGLSEDFKSLKDRLMRDFSTLTLEPGEEDIYYLVKQCMETTHRQENVDHIAMQFREDLSLFSPKGFALYQHVAYPIALERAVKKSQEVNATSMEKGYARRAENANIAQEKAFAEKNYTSPT